MRASRLMAILIILQLRGKVRAIDLAREFEVSVRTIYRDIDELSAAGIPIYGDGGPGGGISLLEGFKTRLTGIEESEAKSLFMIGIPQQAKFLGLGDSARNIANKLLLAMPSEKREKAQKIAQKFHFDFSPWYDEQNRPQYLGELAKSVLNDIEIAFDYESWNKKRNWCVRPLGLVFKANEYYLIGDCVKGSLVFKIDNISNLELKEPFSRQKDFNLEEFWNAHLEAFYSALFQNSAKLLIEESDFIKLKASPYLMILNVEKADFPEFEHAILIEVQYDSDANLVRTIMGSGFRILVKSPNKIVQSLRAAAMKIVDMHQ